MSLLIIDENFLLNLSRFESHVDGRAVDTWLHDAYVGRQIAPHCVLAIPCWVVSERRNWKFKRVTFVWFKRFRINNSLFKIINAFVTFLKSEQTTYLFERRAIWLIFSASLLDGWTPVSKRLYWSKLFLKRKTLFNFWIFFKQNGRDFELSLLRVGNQVFICYFLLKRGERGFLHLLCFRAPIRDLSLMASWGFTLLVILEILWGFELNRRSIPIRFLLRLLLWRKSKILVPCQSWKLALCWVTIFIAELCLILFQFFDFV